MNWIAFFVVFTAAGVIGGLPWVLVWISEKFRYGIFYAGFLVVLITATAAGLISAHHV